MKVIKTYEVEELQCDYCSNQEDLSRRIRVTQCELCKKDICSDHSIIIRFWGVSDRTICLAHLSDEAILGLRK